MLFGAAFVAHYAELTEAIVCLTLSKEINMATATVTSKGQLTIPAEVRKRLGIHAGTRVDFVFAEDGSVQFRPKKIPFERLIGMLKVPGMKPLTPRAIDRAIMRYHAAEDKRIRAQTRSR